MWREPFSVTGAFDDYLVTGIGQAVETTVAEDGCETPRTGLYSATMSGQSAIADDRRSRLDSTLFQFTTRQLWDFIDPNHLLIRIHEQLDFAKLVEPLEDCYCPDFGRLAIHPEVMVRALLICSLYNIASFRRWCSAISENIAYGWFCFLTIDDPVFDHSSISHFIGRDGFAAIFDGLNDELLRLGMLSPEMHVDASPVKANVSGYDLAPSGMSIAEFKERAI